MATKQTDAVAMTEQQLDTVVGGAAFIKFDGVQDGFQLVGGTMCSSRASKQPPAEQNKRPIWQRER
jgi:hypothetical protein